MAKDTRSWNDDAEITATAEPQKGTDDPQAVGSLDVDHDTDAIVDAWFNDTFPGSPVAGHTPIWNFVFAAKDDLKRRLQRKEG